MSRVFSQIVPKTPAELERFYLDAIEKLQGTTSTLSDEDKKSSIPFNGMISKLDRSVEYIARSIKQARFNADNLTAKVDGAERETKRNRYDIVTLQRMEHENRSLRAQITRLESRISDIERQL